MLNKISPVLYCDDSFNIFTHNLFFYSRKIKVNYIFNSLIVKGWLKRVKENSYQKTNQLEKEYHLPNIICKKSVHVIWALALANHTIDVKRDINVRDKKVLYQLLRLWLCWTWMYNFKFYLEWLHSLLMMNSLSIFKGFAFFKNYF